MFLVNENNSPYNESAKFLPFYQRKNYLEGKDEVYKVRITDAFKSNLPYRIYFKSSHIYDIAILEYKVDRMLSFNNSTLILHGNNEGKCNNLIISSSGSTVIIDLQKGEYGLPHQIKTDKLILTNTPSIPSEYLQRYLDTVDYQSLTVTCQDIPQKILTLKK